MIKGVIFDMDGLMMDTERLFLACWDQEMTARGLPVNAPLVAECIGLDHARTKERVLACYGQDFPYSEVMGNVARRSIAHCEQVGVPVKEGLYTLLDFLDEKGIPYAVATSTVHKNAVFRLEDIKVLHRLSGFVTGDMVEKGKPEPDIFLKAAESLGLPPEDCMVLEDSPHGILAAWRAGCRPVMIPDLKQPDEETRRRLFALRENLAQVVSLLEEVNT